MDSPQHQHTYLPILLASALAIAAPAFAGDAASKAVVEPSTTLWEKPAWLTDLSLGVRESYDSNVYVAGADSRFYPANIPAGDLALKNRPSWVTTISPKLGVDLAKAWNADGALKTFALGYFPDIVQFHNTPNEDYTSHRFTTVVKAKEGPVTLNLDNAVTYIDGSHDGLIYPGGYSSFCNSTTRERRDQWQERLKTSVKVDLGPVFVRPALALTYYDLNTEFKNLTNYTNYVDRYDINGGADVGYYLDGKKSMAATLGYRYGYQYQEALPFDAAQTNVSNNYQRVLGGFEGSPLKWLKIEAQVGPQFTTYTDNRPYNNGVKGQGQIDTNPTDVYAEGSVTITPTKSDVLVLKYKRWNWVSSTGKNAYIDSQLDTSYRHQFTEKLQLQLGFKAAQSDYKPTAYRNDWLFTTSAGFRYAFTKNLTGELTYAWDQGVDDQVYGITNPTTRNFERHVVSTGVAWAF